MSSAATDPNGREDLRRKFEEYARTRERAVRIFEHAYLTDLLAKHGDNLSAAARIAGIDRVRLYRLLWQHGLK